MSEEKKDMKIVDLREEQVEFIENKLDEYDENYIKYKLNGQYTNDDDGYSEYFFLKRI